MRRSRSAPQWPWHLATLFMGIGTSLTIAAQEQSAEEAERRLETLVVTASYAEASLWRSAMSGGTLSSEQIEAWMSEHPSEVFFSTPATWISRGDGQEHLTAIRSPVFTGAGACANFSITEDTLPVRAAGFCNANQLFDTFYENAAQLTVWRGPNSSVYGANALYGGINVTTPGAPERSHLLFEAGTEQSARASWNAGTDTLWSFGTLLHDAGWREDASVSQQKIGLGNVSIAGEWTLRSVLQGMHLEQETAGYIEGFERYNDKQASKANENPEAYRDVDSWRAHIRASRAAGAGEWVVLPYWRSNDMEFKMHFVPWQPVEENGHQSIGLRSLWQVESERLRASVGGELEFTDAYLSEYQYEPAPFSPSQFPEGAHYDYDVISQSAALFGDLSYALSARWTLALNLRWDTLHYDYENRQEDGWACDEGVSGCRFYRPADRSDRFTAPSGRVAMSFDLSENQHFFANLGRGFRPPQASELYRLQAPEQGAALTDVTLNAAEIGWRSRGNTFSSQWSLFAMAQQNGIYQNPDRAFLTGAESQHYGVEYELDWQLSAQWGLRWVGTYARHTYANSPDELGVAAAIEGNDMDTAPKLMQRAVLNWEWETERALYLSVTQMGAYFLDPENAYRYDGHVLLDFGAQYRVNTHWRVRMAIKNMADTRYAERADVSFGEYRYFPGLPRRAQLSLEFTL